MQKGQFDKLQMHKYIWMLFVLGKKGIPVFAHTETENQK